MGYGYEDTLDRWARERRERQVESDHRFETARLEQRVRDQESRTQEAYRQAQSMRYAAQHDAQREHEEYREEISYLEQQLEISQEWSAGWKALAKKQRARIAELEALGEEQDD